MIMIYGREGCKWCDEATKFLENANLEYDYIDIMAPDFDRGSLVANSGMTTVPIIFNLDPETAEAELIGGYTDLLEWYK